MSCLFAGCLLRGAGWMFLVDLCGCLNVFCVVSFTAPVFGDWGLFRIWLDLLRYYGLASFTTCLVC